MYKRQIENVVFSVPTGNFGDILAGYISKKMGLNFRKLIIGTNENNILDRTLRTGEHAVKDVISTSSPSIDIQISSNFERLIYDACKDSNVVSELMENLKNKSSYKLPNEMREYIGSYFSSDTANKKEVEEVISSYFNTHNIILDPVSYTHLTLPTNREV